MDSACSGCIYLMRQDPVNEISFSFFSIRRTLAETLIYAFPTCSRFASITEHEQRTKNSERVAA